MGRWEAVRSLAAVTIWGIAGVGWCETPGLYPGPDDPRTVRTAVELARAAPEPLKIVSEVSELTGQKRKIIGFRTDLQRSETGLKRTKTPIGGEAAPTVSRRGGPDDPRVIRAAREAVRRLGVERGALEIGFEMVPIVHLRRTVVGRGEEIGTGARPTRSGGIQIQRIQRAVSRESERETIRRTLVALHARPVKQALQISLSGDILFDFDRSTIRPRAERTLRRLADLIVRMHIPKVVIEGHTDSKGSRAYNLELSLRRAEAVRQWFLRRGGIKGVLLLSRGYGEDRPVAPNTTSDGRDNPLGRARNRRVEIYLYPPPTR